MHRRVGPWRPGAGRGPLSGGQGRLPGLLAHLKPLLAHSGGPCPATPRTPPGSVHRGTSVENEEGAPEGTPYPDLPRRRGKGGRPAPEGTEARLRRECDGREFRRQRAAGGGPPGPRYRLRAPSRVMPTRPPITSHATPAPRAAATQASTRTCARSREAAARRRAPRAPAGSTGDEPTSGPGGPAGGLPVVRGAPVATLEPSPADAAFRALVASLARLPISAPSWGWGGPSCTGPPRSLPAGALRALRNLVARVNQNPSRAPGPLTWAFITSPGSPSTLFACYQGAGVLRPPPANGQAQERSGTGSVEVPKGHELTSAGAWHYGAGWSTPRRPQL